MTAPLISVIVPVYKVEQYLDRCVQSIVDQTYRNMEIILVDDGSPDNCPALCDAWAAKDRRIKVIHKDNGGLSDARNIGLQCASGEWILFIDSDDIISIYLIEALLSEGPQQDSLHIVPFLRFKQDPPVDKSTYSIKRIDNNDLISVRSGYYCWGALYNHNIIKNAKLFFDRDLRNLEDVRWNAIYLLFVRRICCVTTPMYYYRHNPTSITSMCIDHSQQVKAWEMARNSILKWFSESNHLVQYKENIRLLFRHCQNNIIAECVIGNISYPDYKKSQIVFTDKICFLLKQIIPAEYWLIRYAPRFYYGSYCILIRIRNKLVTRRKQV